MTAVRKPTFLDDPSHPRDPELPAANITTRPVPWASAPPPPAQIIPPAPSKPVLVVAPPPVEVPPPPPVFTPPPPADFSPRVEAAINELRLEGQRLAEQARADALEIGILIARKIIDRELTTNLEPLFGIIRTLVRRAGESNRTVVHVAPRDHARIQETGGSDFSLGKVELIADPALEPGDVVVETEHHTLDGRLESRLNELRRDLTQTLLGER